MVTWGLVSSNGAPIDLNSVHVEANMVDCAAEVNVVQVYSTTQEARDAVWATVPAASLTLEGVFFPCG